MSIELDNLTEKLVSLGEDRAELDFWRAVFETLAPEEQDALLDNLRGELEKLKKLT